MFGHVNDIIRYNCMKVNMTLPTCFTLCKSSHKIL
nr:MAG TPA: hypothetical protein [Caudoviricetes sp.]